MPPAAQAQNSSGTKSERRGALLLMGPTGAGKSELALDLARRFPFEIVSVDSAQVYRGMDIGTAKPDLETRARVIHHLIDIREPETSYSAGEFVRDASAVMREIWSRGRQPLLVGGTMLYFHALLGGIARLPEADAQVRADIDARAAADGWAVLHEELRRVDPAAAARIHVNDPQRIQRALEVYRVTGEPITRLQQSAAPAFAERRATGIRDFARGARRPARANRRALRGHVAAGFLGRGARIARKGRCSARNIRRCARSDTGSYGSSLQDDAVWKTLKKKRLRRRDNSPSGS